ncbi:MAG: alpha/beta fold hydrolase [Candidatus Sulfopaludibacter sp.]|nr:alpha/beta fold hydrolase [Candidatus Sulfopaludibacter sp.]
MARGLWTLLVLAILVACGIGYEQVERRRDRARFPRIGRPVDIGGRSLNIYCSGEGTPAVVLESDALTPGFGWAGVQREISRFTRGCWYDRAGYGWSDPAPAPHDSTASARDLHALLKAAGVTPPFVLAGAGLGAFNIRVYCGLFPDEVAGVVLVDAPHEDEWNEARGGMSRVPFGLGYPPDAVLRALSSVGLMRLAAPANRQVPYMDGLTPAERVTLEGLMREPGMRAAFLAEQGFSSGPREAHAAGGLGSRPLIVLTSERSLESERQIARLERQELLAELSTRGRRAALKDSGSIVAAVREVVGASAVPR